MDDTSDLAPPPAPATLAWPAEKIQLGKSLAIYGSDDQRRALFAALARARGNYGKLCKSATVKTPQYTHDYATLADVLEATMPATSAEGLALSFFEEGDEKQADLHTLLSHKEGGFIHTSEPLAPVTKATDRGGQLTYKIRYQTSAVLLVAAEEDDDATAGQALVTRRGENKPPAAARQPEPTKAPAAAAAANAASAAAAAQRPPSSPPPPPSGTLLLATKNALKAEFDRLQLEPQARSSRCKEVTGRMPADLTEDLAQRLLENLRAG